MRNSLPIHVQSKRLLRQCAQFLCCLLAPLLLITALAIVRAQEKVAEASAASADAKSAEIRNQRIAERLKSMGGDLYPVDIFGRAVNKAGQPVAGATIYLACANSIRFGESLLAQTKTAADGSYEFLGVPLPVVQYPERVPTSVRQGLFEVSGIADGYGFTWQGDRSYRPVPRPADADAKDDGRIFYSSEKIVTALVFSPPATLRGRITDDTGQPLKDTRIELNHIRDLEDETAPSQPAKRGSTFANYLPDSLHHFQTDADGMYSITGLPREAAFGIQITYRPHFEDKYLFIGTATGQRPGITFVGHEGVLDVELKAPRVVRLHVSYGNANQNASGVTVRVRPLQRGTKGTSGQTDEKGWVSLPLMPGDYTFIAEPRFGDPYVITEQQVEVKSQPAEQSQELPLSAAATVLLQAIDAETGLGIPGVDFLVGSDTSAERRDLTSQTVFVDHPTTDEGGRVKAVIAPGHYQFVVNTLPTGYQPIRKTSDSQDLSIGEPTKVRFEFRKEAETAAEVVAADETENPIPTDLIEKWRRQAGLLDNGIAKIRIRRASSPWTDKAELSAILNACTPSEVPNLAAFANRGHPDQDFRFSEMEILNDGPRFRESSTYAEGEVTREASLLASNGKEAVMRSGANRQADVFDRKNFHIHAMAISELCLWPRFALHSDHRPPTIAVTTTVNRVEGKLVITRTSGEEAKRTTQVLTVDAETGFVFSESIQDVARGWGRETWQFAPRSYPNGAVVPTMHVTFDHQQGKIRILKIYQVQKLELGVPFSPEAFVVSAPPGTNVVDHRGGHARNPKSSVAREPITDLVAFANLIPAGNRSLTEVVKVGDDAPPLSAAKWLDQNGDIEPPLIKGKITVVYFWDLGCGSCMSSLPDVQSAVKYYAGKEVSIISVHGSGELATAVQHAAKKRDLTFPIAMDQDGPEGFYGATTAAFGIRGVPQAAVIDREGRLAQLGEWDEALQKVEGMLKN